MRKTSAENAPQYSLRVGRQPQICYLQLAEADMLLRFIREGGSSPDADRNGT